MLPPTLVGNPLRLRSHATSDYPRPMKGIWVAITVINGTLTSSGKFAI
jgi:hypothetical protein